MKYDYCAEKLAAARSCLMLPHPKGEGDSIAVAFHECELGLRDLSAQDFDENAREWVAKIRELMDKSKIISFSGHNTWAFKAEHMTEDQKVEFSQAVDNLADWFNEKAREE